MKTYIWWWLGISYVLGLFIFAMEHGGWERRRDPLAMKVRLVLLVLSPLTAWHAVLHYAQVAYCKLRNRPLKFWI
jgi:hypothetical protein